MSFIIARRNEHTGRVEYVAPPGSERSFTRDISRARRFTHREQAEADRCPDNEWITTI